MRKRKSLGVKKWSIGISCILMFIQVIINFWLIYIFERELEKYVSKGN